MVFLLHHLLSKSAAECPDKDALVFNNEKMTYAELERESNMVANGLVRMGIERGERVGIYINRCIASVTGALGILKAGAAYVPIDPLCPAGRLSYIIDKCRVKTLITVREKLTNSERPFPGNSRLESILVMNGPYDGSGTPGSAKVVNWQTIREEARVDAPHVNTLDSDLAYILFTSGSTGNPKGVMLTHLNALTFINSAYELFGIKKDDTFSNICPLYSDMSVFDLFVAFKAGATIVIIPETAASFPVKLAEVIEKHKISVWNSVPSLLSLLSTYKNLDRHDLSSLRLVLFAGELFPLKYLRRMMEALPRARFCNMYGQTEANSSTCYRVEQLPADAKGPLPIGKPLPNFDVFALDEGGKKITRPGQEGEFYVRASTVATGYWDEAETTEKSFVKNPLSPGSNERVYRTGDIVRLDADGNYVFVCRKDHMIKSRGYRIEIGEIETVLCNHPEIKNAVVLPIADPLIGNRISAIVVPFVPGSIGKEEIASYCSRFLPRYMIPEIIEFHGVLPATSSGKIDRKNLNHREQKASVPAGHQDIGAPW